MAAAIGWFADPIFLGHESALLREMLGDRLPSFTDDEWKLVKDSSDFYGCNTCRFSHAVQYAHRVDTTNFIKPGSDDVSTATLNSFSRTRKENRSASHVSTCSSLRALICC